jgi:acetyl-CoA acetyltransferase family protein
MTKPDVLIVGGARTPMTDYVGALKDISALELGAIAARGAFEKYGIKPEGIDHAVIGNVLQTSADAIYGARHVALKAGLGVEVPALTVNRLCGSGIQALVSATHLLQLGEARTVLAGGMESMSQAPHVIRGLRQGLRMGQGQLEDLLFAALRDSFCDLFMAQTAEKLARSRGIDRAAQDEFAYRSMAEARRALAAGLFAEEIVPVKVKGSRGEEEVREDDHLFQNPSLETMAKLPPAFGKDGMVTAGNASGIVDGAAALVLASPAAARAAGAPPLAEILDWGIAGVDPSIMGIGPVPAIRQVLERTGLRLADIDLFEINEAFAGQYLAVEKDLGLDRARVNVNGGAIALGHPLGATGARLVLTLAHELRRRRARHGIASACIGGGQGIAIVIRNPQA